MADILAPGELRIRQQPPEPTPTLKTVSDSLSASRYAVSGATPGGIPSTAGGQGGPATGGPAGAKTNVQGKDSVAVTQSANLFTVSFVNDALAPGNLYAYGTGTAGAKGFFQVSSAIAVASTARLTDTVGSNGVSTLDLANVPNTGGGSLLRILRDAWGRITGTSAPVITDLQGAGLVVPQGYIDGLQMAWISNTSISVSSGNAYIPSLGNVLANNSTLTLSGLSLTASTWYHVYLYSNAGTPAIECVTTAPAAPYNGTARAKTGDASRRYIGSVLTDSAGNVINFDHAAADGSVLYKHNINSDGLLLINVGQATVNTIINCAGAVPITATRLYAFFDNSSDSIVYVSSADIPAASTSMFYIRQAPTGSDLQIKSYISLYNLSIAYQLLNAPATGTGIYCYASGYTFMR